MGALGDVIVAIPIGVLYNIFFHKIGEIINNECKYDEKIQRNLILTFIGGLIGFILAFTIFSTHKSFSNRAVKYGLYFGSLLLFFHTLVYNWNVIGDDIKLFIVTITMALLICYAYSNKEEEEEKEIKNILKTEID